MIWARSVPGLTIYGNGDIFETDYGIWEGPPQVSVSHADPAEIARFVADVEASELVGDDDAYGFPNVTDIPSTSVTVHGAGSETSVSVYGLEETFDEYVERAGEVDRRAALRDIIDRGYAFGGDPEPYRPESLEVLDLGDDTYGATDDPPVWPGPDPAGFGPADRWEGCAEVTANVETLLAAAEENDAATWSTPIGNRVLIVKPLLPGEIACGMILARAYPPGVSWTAWNSTPMSTLLSSRIRGGH